MKQVFLSIGKSALGCLLSLCLLLSGCSSDVLAPPSESDTAESESTSGAVDVFAPVESTLPCITIETADEKPITSGSRYKAATLSVTGGKYAHYNITVDTQIRGRGHSSFDGKADQTDYASKNSYRLKLDQKANLLGVGETADRDWILISGKYDVSALRNHFAWHLAEQMGSIPYVPAYTWVNVCINGDFRGMYTLVEVIEVASDRVDIDDSPSTDPNQVGYLVEYDLRGAYQSGAKEGLTYFYIPGLDETFAWSIQSEVYDEEVTAAIRAHLIACNEAILSGDRARMEALVDMEAFVDMFILQELTKNPDAGCSSFYMQRDAGEKLCLSAPWDFDFAMGAYSVSQTTSGLVADGEGVQSHPWFEFLTTQPWFMSLVLERMEEVAPLVEASVASVRATSLLLKEAADQNHARWNLYGVKFSPYPSNQVSVERHSYEEHVDFLTSWIEKRWTKLEKEIEKRAE